MQRQLDDLRGLHAILAVAIDLLERLQPVMTAWTKNTDALQERLATPPDDEVTAASSLGVRPIVPTDGGD